MVQCWGALVNITSHQLSFLECEVQAGLDFEEAGNKSSVDKHLMSMFPEKYRSRRYAQRALHHRWQWNMIPDKLASKWIQVPNKWKRAFKNAPLKGRCPDTHGLPSEVEEMIAKVIIDLTEGESSTFRRAEPVDFSDLAETMRVAVEAVNEEVAVSLEDVRRHNQSLLSELANGSIEAEECEDGLLEEPKPVSLKSIPNMVRSLKKKYGFSRQKVNTAGTYLEPDDPVMLECLV